MRFANNAKNINLKNVMNLLNNNILINWSKSINSSIYYEALLNLLRHDFSYVLKKP